MAEAHRRYLIFEQGIGSAVFNFVLNGAIAWLLFSSLEFVPLWGDKSIAGDTIGTAFILPFLTCLIVTRLARGQVRSGRLPPFEWRRSEHPILGRLPHGTLGRGFVLGLLCVLLTAPLSLWAMHRAGVEGLSFWGFIAFKATFAGVLAAIVTPVVALCALGDCAPTTAGRPS